MEKHLTDKMSVHMSLLAKQNDQITQANYILIQSNEKLGTKLSAMNKDVEKLKRALLDVTVWLLHKSLGTLWVYKKSAFFFLHGMTHQYKKYSYDCHPALL